LQRLVSKTKFEHEIAEIVAGFKGWQDPCLSFFDKATNILFMDLA